MDKWPFVGGLLAAVAALVRILKETSELFQYLMVIGTFLVFLSYILHELGMPVPNLLPFLPVIGNGSGN